MMYALSHPLVFVTDPLTAGYDKIAPLMTTVYSQLDAEQVLSTLFASSARVSILRVFMLDPYRPYYQRQLEQATGLAIRAVQRELDRLAGVGLLFRHAEGNRTYHQVDTDFPLFMELRNLVLKAGSALDGLRSRLAMDPAVRLAFWHEASGRVLVVARPGQRLEEVAAAGFAVETTDSETFVRWLSEKHDALRPFLVEGVDILGRRDDVIWRRIEASGYTVQKGEGIP